MKRQEDMTDSEWAEFAYRKTMQEIWRALEVEDEREGLGEPDHSNPGETGTAWTIH